MNWNKGISPWCILFPKIFRTWRFRAFALLGGQFPTILTVLFSVSWWLFSTTEVVDPYKFLGIKISCSAVFFFRDSDSFIAIKGNPWSLVVGNKASNASMVWSLCNIKAFGCLRSSQGWTRGKLSTWKCEIVMMIWILTFVPKKHGIYRYIDKDVIFKAGINIQLT